jgi:DNA-directed RNA polymerase subunit omega
MARVTVEDCLEVVKNRFALTILASKRSHQLFKGAPPLVKRDNKFPVISLREIAQNKVFFKQDIKKEIIKYIEKMKERG